MPNPNWNVDSDVEDDIGDLSDQTGNEVIESARGVEFEVREASLDVVKDKQSGDVMMKKLRLQARVGAMGTDGNGKYKNKVLFADLITSFDPERYTSDWWKKQARFPLKAFLQATGYDPKTPPKISQAFCDELKGKRFKADITQEPIKAKIEGEWQDTGEKKNELRNFKKLDA